MLVCCLWKLCASIYFDILQHFRADQSKRYWWYACVQYAVTLFHMRSGVAFYSYFMIVLQFLRETGYPHPLTYQNLQSPSGKEFCGIFNVRTQRFHSSLTCVTSVSSLLRPHAPTAAVVVHCARQSCVTAEEEAHCTSLCTILHSSYFYFSL